MAVAAVMPRITSRARYRVAKVIAISWLLSPSSATKMTTVLSRKAYISGVLLGSAGGDEMWTSLRPSTSMSGCASGRKSRPPDVWPDPPGPRASVSTNLLGTTPFRPKEYMKRSEAQTYELKTLMRTPYAVFCLKQPHNYNH